MMHRLFLLNGVALALMQACGVFARPAGEAGSTFAMEEVSVFEAMARAQDFTRGHYTQSQPTAFEEVRTYPHLASREPLYGVLDVHRTRLDAAPSETALFYVVDESEGTGKGYDRLYLDVDQDRDLSNDTPLRPVKTPRGVDDGLGPSMQYTYFETVSVACETTSGEKQPVDVVPRLNIYDKTNRYLTFLQRQVRKGAVTIQGREYLALLGHPHTASARFDTPSTGLYLLQDSDDRYRSSWWGRDTLAAVQRFGDVLYRFAATPTGDRLTIEPYTGELGVFRVDAGDRTLEGKVTMNGSLSSPTVNTAVGDSAEDGWPRPASRCRIPVGDYYPSFLTVQFGPLRVQLSNNYHARNRTSGPGEPACGIRIRPDTPYVLDFSNEPEVLFASPAAGEVIEAGTTSEVAAVLVDTELDVMIRGLDDTRRKVKKQYSVALGQNRTYEEDYSLDAKVLITRADGERVVEGVMPFG